MIQVRVTNIELPKTLYVVMGLTDITLTALQIGQKYADKLQQGQQASSPTVTSTAIRHYTTNTSTDIISFSTRRFNVNGLV